MSFLRRVLAPGALTLVFAACDTAVAPLPAIISVEIRSVGDIGVGDTVPVFADLVSSLGDTTPAQAVWNSLSRSVATVDSAGHLVARDTGDVRIVASVGAMADTARLHVSILPRRIAFTVVPADSLAVTDLMVVKAVAYDGLGRPIAGAPIAYVMSDSMASSPFVLDSGSGRWRARPLRGGAFTIVASSGSARAERPIRFVLPRVALRDLALTQLSWAREHGCGLDASGTAWCWGSNEFGQLGRAADAATWQRALPVVGAPTFETLATGGDTSCGITATHRLWCWGYIGDSGTRTPYPVLPDSQFTRVSPDWNTCALTSGGHVMCWGRTDGVMIPAPRAVLPDSQFVDVAAVWWVGMGCGVLRSGRALCWWSPDNLHGELATLVPTGSYPPLRKVAVGQGFGCGLTTTGEIWCWGYNFAGQLGIGAADDDRSWVARRVQSTETFTDVDADGWHACGLTSSGRIACWGRHPLEDATNIARRYRPVGITSDAPFRALVMGDVEECGLLASSNELRCLSFFTPQP